MLLPPQFQTPAPDALGAKVVVMPAPPKPPHVHQWLAVPDSKIHSRCAECGTVTLTEIVNPRPTLLGFDPAAPGGDTTVFNFAPTARGAELLRDVTEKTRALDPAEEITDGQLDERVRAFFSSAPDHELALEHARSLLKEMGYKRVFGIPEHRRAEFLKALTAPQADPDGWIKNTGTQPVADDVWVQVKIDGFVHSADDARDWDWFVHNAVDDITHWRLAK
jgi:hypothetical protein